MKKVFSTLSAILLATACLTPGLAWAAGNPSVTLDQSGDLKAADATGVHSVLLEMTFVGGDADKVTDVALKDAPGNALSSVVYSAADKKATIAVSAGNDALALDGSSLGKVDVIASGASAETPLSVEAKLTSLEFIDSDDSSADAKSGTVDANQVVRLTSTESVAPPVDENTGTGDGSGNGTGIGGNGEGAGNGGSAGMGSGIGGGTAGNGSGGTSAGNGSNAGNGTATTTADYKASGVVSSTQTGQSAATGGSTGLVQTGDVVLICGIALVVAAACAFIAFGLLRKKKVK